MAPRKSPEAAAHEPGGDGTADAGFEESLERLETLVEELEAGTLTLEESISRYEEGMRLSRRLTRTLEEAEKRIERLIATERGEPATRPMDLDAEDAPPPESGPGPARRDPAPKKRTGSGGMEELPF